MTVRSRTNHYRGINAHLHSLWQAQGGWSGFHTVHIGDLAKTLRVALWPLGYTAEVEPSLQIRRLPDPPSRPVSDVLIFDRDALRARQPATGQGFAPSERVMPLPVVLEEPALSEKPFRAIAVYPRAGEQSPHGAPVAWLELLSPSNKGYRRDAEIYQEKRADLLESGLVFIELDYLHESPPTVDVIAPYPLPPEYPSTIAAHPYRLLIFDPRPTWQEGQVYIHEFDVDMEIPVANIPLSADDVIRFDFGAPYRKTFEEMLYGLETVDYSTLPVNFDRYSAADQLRILRRMLTVIDAAHKGHDLARAPLPLIDTPDTVAAALARLAELTTGEVSP